MPEVTDTQTPDAATPRITSDVLLAAIEHEINLAEKEFELMNDRYQSTGDKQLKYQIAVFGRNAQRRANRLKKVIS